MFRVFILGLIAALLVFWIPVVGSVLAVIAFVLVVGAGFLVWGATGTLPFHCPYCGKGLRAGASACHHCGRTVA